MINHEVGVRGDVVVSSTERSRGVSVGNVVAATNHHVQALHDHVRCLLFSDGSLDPSHIFLEEAQLIRQ